MMRGLVYLVCATVQNIRHNGSTDTKYNSMVSVLRGYYTTDEEYGGMGRIGVSVKKAKSV